MAISFCKKCKNILPPKGSGENFDIICHKCGTGQKRKTSLISKEFKEKKVEKGKGVGDGNPFATYKNVCKKCGYDQAQIIDVPAKYSDEDDLIFLKCGRCGFSKKIGRKAS